MVAVPILLLSILAFQDLDSPDPAEARRAIERAIRKGDEAALEAASKTSRGARLALAEVRAHKRFGDAYPMPCLVTLNGKDRPVGEVAAALSRTIGMKVDVKDLNLLDEVKLSFDFEDTPLLEAVDVLGRAMNRNPEIIKDGILFSASPFKPLGPVSYARTAKFTLSTYTEHRDLLGVGGAGEGPALWGHTMTDGVIRLAGHRGFRVDEVTDDAGRPVPPETHEPGPDFRAVDATTGGFQLYGPLKRPPEASARRVSVRGAWLVTLPEGPLFGDLPLADPSRVLKAENLNFQITEFGEDGDTFTVTARSGDPKKAHVPPSPKDFHFVGKDGKTLPAQGAVRGTNAQAQVELAFDVPVGFEGTALRVRHFKSVGDHEIPFEFKDVPIR